MSEFGHGESRGLWVVGHLWAWAFDVCVILWATREGKQERKTKIHFLFSVVI